LIDIVTGESQISDAGHPPFLLIRNKEVRIISGSSGPPLGILPEVYPVSKYALKDGDRLIFLTDGVFEAKNREGKRLGFNTLVAFVKNNRSEEHLIDKISEYVNKFSKGAERADDLTLMEVRFLKQPY
jgi:phosphoserine phosphatase RsbU/P